MHHNSSSEKPSSRGAAIKSSPTPPSRTFRFPLAGSAPCALPNLTFPKKNLFGRSQSISLGFNPNRVVSSSMGPTTQVGLGAVRDLARATNTNKNLVLRPLVTTHLPVLSHRAPPVTPPCPRGARRQGLYSKLSAFFLQSFGTRVSKVVVGENGALHQATNNWVNGTCTPIDQVVVAEHSMMPRKKAKISEHGDRKERFIVVKKKLYPLYPTRAFMRYCFGCSDELDHTKDIYIYRGEMAFCTIKCRERVMHLRKREKMKKKAQSSCSTSSNILTRKPTMQNLRNA